MLLWGRFGAACLKAAITGQWRQSILIKVISLWTDKREARSGFKRCPVVTAWPSGGSNPAFALVF